MGKYPRPYADVDDPAVHGAIERAVEIADATGQAGRVRCGDGRELIVPPQPPRCDEEPLRRNGGSQSFYCYNIFEKD